jgi:hypothetical protein
MVTWDKPYAIEEFLNKAKGFIIRKTKDIFSSVKRY